MRWEYYDDGYCGRVEAVSLDVTASKIIVKGKITEENIEDISAVAFYALPLYADEEVADYWRLPPFARLENPKSPDFFTETELLSLTDIDSRHGEIFTSKVVAVAEKKNGNRRLVDNAKYLSNPEAAAVNKAPMPELKTPKGVGLLIPSDLAELECKVTSINVLLSGMLTMKNHGPEKTIVYNYEDEEYYFRKSQIDMIDQVLSNCTRNGIALIAILIMHSTGVDDPDVPDRYFIHPDAHNAIDLVVPDMTNMRATQYYKAMISFLSGRYNGVGSNSPGRMYGYIVGNEIGTTHCWNCMGNKTLKQYVDGYHRWLRLTYNLVRANDAGAHVYASFDHNWNTREIQPFFISFENKEVFDSLMALGKREGDFGWELVWHPYPQNIYKIDTWNDPDCDDNFETKFITFKNIQVICRYLKLEQNLFRGKPRQLALTEQGFTSTDNSEENQLLQAAAYAYAYYKVLMNGIEVFSMNGHVDNGLEMGLSLGLWSAQKGTVNRADKKKRIYEVFRKIDTSESFEVSNFALGIISKTSENPVNSWEDIIPEFNYEIIKEKCTRPPEETAPLIKASAKGKDLISLGVLTADNDTKDFKWNEETHTASADICAGAYNPDVPQDYKGLRYIPNNPLDLSDTPILSVSVRVSDIPDGGALYKLRIYSGDKVLETKDCEVSSNEWSALAVDLSNFSGVSSVDQIRVWTRAKEDIALRGGKVEINSVSAGKAD